jgi:hypothetical protein
MPVGAPTLVSLTAVEFIEGDFFGFVKATINTPVGEYLGILSIRLNGRLVCPTGGFEGLFFSEELRFALNHGYQIVAISQAYSFDRGDNLFKDLIVQLNEMKIRAQAEGQPTLRNVAKLLMNSMYGRFGMHVDNTKAEVVSQDRSREIMNTFLVTNILSLGGMELISYEIDQPLSINSGGKRLLKSQHQLPGQTNVPIAAAITAYARMLINQLKVLALKSDLEIDYSDTDSLVLNGPLPPEYIDPAQLGMLKLEHVIEEGYFVAPKIYWLQTAEGVEVSRCKGFPGTLTKEEVVRLYEGRTLEKVVTKWTRSLGAGEVRIQKGIAYKLTAQLNKRDKVFDAQGKWVDTKGLVLNQL